MLNLKKTVWIAFLAALAFPVPANAAGLWDPATITRISVSAGGVAFINVEPGASKAGHVKAACSVNGFWEVAFDATTPTGQAMLSLAVSAKLSKSPVRITGSGTCPAWGSVEGIAWIDILPVE